MNLEEVYLDKIWKIINSCIPNEELMLSSEDEDKITEKLKSYHKDKLKAEELKPSSTTQSVLTNEAFYKWRKNLAFLGYASGVNSKGEDIDLGIDGGGNYIVRVKNSTGTTSDYYNNANKAIRAYIEQVR